MNNAMFSEIEKENARQKKIMEAVERQRKREKKLCAVRIDSKTVILVPKRVNKHEYRKSFLKKHGIKEKVSLKDMEEALSKRDKEILKMYDNGTKQVVIAEEMGVSIACVHRLKKKFRG